MGGFITPGAGTITNVCGGTISALLRAGYIEPVFCDVDYDNQKKVLVPGMYIPTIHGRKELGKLLGEVSENTNG